MKIVVRVIACASLLAAAVPASAQVLLYANGNPPPLLSTGPVTDSGVMAPAGTTWSEVQHPAGNTAEANNVSGFAVTQGTFRLADDFTVPAPGWMIQFVEFHSYLTGAPASPSPFTGMTVRIWGPCTPGTIPGAPGCTNIAFGDTTTNVMTTSTDATMFRIFNTVAPPPGTAPGTTRKIWRQRATVSTNLAPGVYWIDWASTVTGNAGHFNPSLTVPGSRGLAGWNAQQLTVATNTWAPVIDTGNPAAAPDFPQDLPFEIYGQLVPVELMDFDVK